MKNKNITAIALAGVLMLFAGAAMAQASAIDILQTSMDSSLTKISEGLQPWAFRILASFILIQFVWTNFGLITNGGDIHQVFAKLGGSLFWFGIILVFFSKGPQFIADASTQIIQKVSGVSGANFDPVSPLKRGISVVSQLMESVNGTQGILGSLNPFPALIMALVAVVVLAVSCLISFKVLMLFIETKIVVAMTPISLMCLGLNGLRDQGMTPFKYLLSLLYRVVILAAVMTAMIAFSADLAEVFKALPKSDDPSIWPPIWAAAMGYGILGAIAYRSDSIAAMLSSGTSQMTSGDAGSAVTAAGNMLSGTGSTAQAGVAAGGAAIAGGAAAGAAIRGAMEGISGGGASITNAGSGGSGASSGSGGSGGMSMSMDNTPQAPQRPPTPPSKFETNSRGAPIRPSGPAGGDSTGGAPMASGGPSAAGGGSGSTSGGPSAAGGGSGSTSGAPMASGAPSAAGGGSMSGGQDAGIGGPSAPSRGGSSSQGQGQGEQPKKKKGALDHLSDARGAFRRAGQQEKPHVSVTINTHSDH